MEGMENLSNSFRPSTPSTLQVPRHGGRGCKRHGSSSKEKSMRVNRVEAVRIFDDERDVIKHCDLYSRTVIGKGMRSFSRNDLMDLGSMNDLVDEQIHSVSLLNLCERITRLETGPSMTRSDSAWAIADPLSQMPSPSRSMIGLNASTVSSIGAADLIRSLARTSRHKYVKKRLISLYKLSTTMATSQQPESDITSLLRSLSFRSLSVANLAPLVTSPLQPLSVSVCPPSKDRGEGRKDRIQARIDELNEFRQNRNRIQEELSTVTIQDVSLQRGRDLSELERKLFLFNWILVHSEETGCESSIPSSPSAEQQQATSS